MGTIATLFLITARGGSKGVPGKNLMRIGGRSLIQWKADAAKPLVQEADRLIISTDSEDIAAEARRVGVQVPFMRSAELATDEASSASVINHALDSVGNGFDRVMLLEPSAPFATSVHMWEAVQMYDQRAADLVVGMKSVAPASVFVGVRTPDNNINHITSRGIGNTRRQDTLPEWTMNGALYLFKTESFRKTGSIYGGALNFGLMMSPWHSIEIDTPHDLNMAWYAFEKGFVGQ